MLRLTGPLVILLITATFLFLAATNIQLGWLYMLDALLWSVLLIAVLLPFLQMRRLKLERSVLNTAEAGQDLHIQIKLSQTGFWPLAFVNLDDLPMKSIRSESTASEINTKGFVSYLAKGDTYTYSYAQPTHTDGVYLFQGFKAGSFGPLGLIGLYWKQKLPGALVVLPTQPEHSIQLLSEDHQSALNQARRRSHHNEEISHFREYQAGDSKRAIHWKNSAKLQKLVVSESRDEPFQQAIVLVDTATGQDKNAFYKLVTKAKEICFSLVQDQLELVCMAQKADPEIWQNWGLDAPQRALQAVKDWNALSYWLATLEPDSPLSLADSLRESSFNHSDRLMILLTTRPDSALISRLLHGSQSDALPLIVFAPAGVDLPTEHQGRILLNHV